MDKLQATDAAFLYSETPRTPNHIATVQILDLPQGVEPQVFASGLVDWMAPRVRRVAYMTRKLKMTPFDLDHPVWIEDGSFDIANHIHAEMIEPDGQTALAAAVGQKHSQVLDRSKPLWDVTVFHGFSEGQVALYHRVHHACLDGAAAQYAFMQLMDKRPEGCETFEMTGRLNEPEPDAEQLVTEAWLNIARAFLDQQTHLTEAIDSAARMNRRWRSPTGRALSEWTAAPPTRLNRAIGAERTVAFGKMDLATVKRMCREKQVTVNDFFLAACSGALRKYLERTDDLPDVSLQAGCPVSLRCPGDQSLNNQVVMMRVALGTHLEDPQSRLAFVHRSAINAKEATAEMSGLLPRRAAAPGLPLWMTWMGAATQLTPQGLSMSLPVNLVISNVPGPRMPLYCNRARMISHFPVSIPTHGLGLNITVQSYAGELFYGVTACARTVPDPQLLAGLIREEAEALVADYPRAYLYTAPFVEVPDDPLNDGPLKAA